LRVCAPALRGMTQPTPWTKRTLDLHARYSKGCRLFGPGNTSLPSREWPSQAYSHQKRWRPCRKLVAQSTVMVARGEVFDHSHEILPRGATSRQVGMPSRQQTDAVAVGERNVDAFGEVVDMWRQSGLRRIFCTSTQRFLANRAIWLLFPWVTPPAFVSAGTADPACGRELWG
jgi:hypothetical protein